MVKKHVKNCGHNFCWTENLVLGYFLLKRIENEFSAMDKIFCLRQKKFAWAEGKAKAFLKILKTLFFGNFLNESRSRNNLPWNLCMYHCVFPKIWCLLHNTCCLYAVIEIYISWDHGEKIKIQAKYCVYSNRSQFK